MNTTMMIVLVGPPACGKSTIARELGNKYPDKIQVVCSDAIRGEIHGDESVQLNNQEVFRIFYDRAEQALDQGKSVILDATNVLRKNRQVALDRLYWKTDLAVAAVFQATSQDAYDRCIERNENRKRKVPEFVIERMFNSLKKPKNWPTLAEGFDVVIDLDELKNFVDVAMSSSEDLQRLVQ